MIQTDRIRLRRWCESDREPFARMNSDPKVMEFLGDPISREKSDAAIDRWLKFMDEGEPAFWAAERKQDGAFIGFIGVKPFTFEAAFTPGYEIGWRLGGEYWGRGYATEGARAALNFSFARWEMSEIHAITVPANVRSQTVMQKIGMHRAMEGDFEHPAFPKDHKLSRHVLFRIERPVLAK